MDIKEVYAINGWSTGTRDDAQIEMLIPLYRGMAEEYCNRDFTDGQEPFGVKKFIADCIGFSETGNVQSKSMGTVSITYRSDIPQAMYQSLNPFREMRW